jgi:WhiB family transcriptional regulator, redox-sensing transcriptional regulator
MASNGMYPGPSVRNPHYDLPRKKNLKMGNWREEAACVGETELFFHVSSKRGAQGAEERAERAAKVAMAKEICGWCPVREECREYAVVNREEHGVWGGLTADELKKERGRRARARQAQAKGKVGQEQVTVPQEQMTRAPAAVPTHITPRTGLQVRGWGMS